MILNLLCREMQIIRCDSSTGDSMNNDVLSAKNLKSCVLCGKPMQEKYKPFCSKRCADIDLHRWFSGAYAVPAPADPEDEEGNNAEDA